MFLKGLKLNLPKYSFTLKTFTYFKRLPSTSDWFYSTCSFTLVPLDFISMKLLRPAEMFKLLMIVLGFFIFVDHKTIYCSSN